MMKSISSKWFLLDGLHVNHCHTISDLELLVRAVFRIPKPQLSQRPIRTTVDIIISQ